MTQTIESVQPTNVPFNLIVTASREAAQKIAAHYGLSDVRFVNDLTLPAGGPKRGAALNELLGKLDHTVTLVVLVQEVWVSALVKNLPLMASSVWRSVESQLMGHHTIEQRNLLVVAADLKGAVGDAEEAGTLLCLNKGRQLPNNWRPQKVLNKPAAIKVQPVAAAVKGNQTKRERPGKSERQASAPPTFGKVYQGNAPSSLKVKNATHSGKVGNPDGLKMSKTDRTKRNKPAGNNARLHDDLYLLAKGHYGPVERDAFLVKAGVVMAYHAGSAGNSGFGLNKIATTLFQTLINKSSRGYWGGFNVLKEMVGAGAQGQTELVMALFAQIAAIPVVDAAGQPLTQPKLDLRVIQRLGGRLPEVAEKVEVTQAA